MSLEKIKTAISDEQFQCPKCKLPIRQFDKFVETIDSVWDGAGDSHSESSGCKVTLICGNNPCSWQERTEYWENYLRD